jgi:DsbC/DsbD-like thiol-disulfide interchange protein
MTFRAVLPLLTVLALCLGAAMPARAQQGADVIDMRVLPGWRTASGTHVAALEIRLREGWKTYWRAPGDAGIPPQFDWRRSRNLSGVEVIWPTPEISVSGGLRTIGYSDVLVLPLRLAPAQAGGDIKLRGTVDLGVCKDVCVPVTLRVNERLPRAATKPDPRIAAAMASRPYSAAEAGVSRVTCRITPVEDGLGLRAEIDMPGAGGTETTVIEVDDPRIWVAPARAARKGNRLVAETRLYHVEGHAFALDRSGIRITVLGQSRAVDIQGCAAG